MTVILNRIAGKVKFNCRYKCAGCGVEAIGGTGEATFDVDTFGDLAAKLANLRTGANQMPVEWASFYATGADIYKCPKCKDKT